MGWTEIFIKKVWVDRSGELLDIGEFNRVTCIRIFEIIEKTFDYKMDLAIITNGQKLNGLEAEILADNASWVRISANDCDAETFSKTRGRNERWFHERNENIKRFAEIKKLK